jgi:hypothetical protein
MAAGSRQALGLELPEPEDACGTGCSGVRLRGGCGSGAAFAARRRDGGSGDLGDGRGTYGVSERRGVSSRRPPRGMRKEVGEGRGSALRRGAAQECVATWLAVVSFAYFAYFAGLFCSV